MSRKVIVIVALAFLAGLVPGAVFAYRNLPYANQIYNVPYEGSGIDPVVSVFDDRDNKCYVVVGDGGASKENVAISCVKR